MQKKVAAWLVLWMAFACLIALPAGAEPQKMDPSVWLARFETYAAQFDLKVEYSPEQWKDRVPSSIMMKQYSGVSVSLFGEKPGELDYVFVSQTYSTDEVGKNAESEDLKNLLSGSLCAAYAWFSKDPQEEDAAESLITFAKAFKECYPDGSDSQETTFTWKGLQVQVSRMTLSTHVMWDVVLLPDF